MMFSLASSFRLRNKLKERISELKGAIQGADFSKSVGTEENTSPCDGKTLVEAIAEVDVLMELLRELNGSIEAANRVNRDFLINLETLKAKIAFYETIAQRCRNSKTYDFEYDERGERIRVPKEPLVDQNLHTAALASLKREKDALEEKIAAANFTVSVDFDPERALSRL